MCAATSSNPFPGPKPDGGPTTRGVRAHSNQPTCDSCHTHTAHTPTHTAHTPTHTHSLPHTEEGRRMLAVVAVVAVARPYQHMPASTTCEQRCLSVTAECAFSA